jgi:hypothetical protein
VKKFSYEVEGKDGAGQAFKVAGEVEAPGLPDAVVEAQRQTYQGLTSGKTQYGQPGVGGCKGPYSMERIEVKVING